MREGTWCCTTQGSASLEHCGIAAWLPSSLCVAGLLRSLCAGCHAGVVPPQHFVTCRPAVLEGSVLPEGCGKLAQVNSKSPHACIVCRVSLCRVSCVLAAGFRQPTLTRVQVGLVSLARELKGDLDSIAARADTGSSKGLHQLLQGEQAGPSVCLLVCCLQGSKSKPLWCVRRHWGYGTAAESTCGLCG